MATSKLRCLATCFAATFLMIPTAFAFNWQTPGWTPGSVPCPDNGQSLGLNTQAVLQWKQSAPNGWLSRGHVFGYVVALEPNQSGHDHFIIQIGNGPKDVLEVIYNMEFGALPPLAMGQAIEACGDFIQSYAQNGPYPPSPAGAIIHWVHVNPDPARERHDSGFLIINDQMFGTDTSNVQPLPYYGLFRGFRRY